MKVQLNLFFIQCEAECTKRVRDVEIRLETLIANSFVQYRFRHCFFLIFAHYALVTSLRYKNSNQLFFFWCTATSPKLEPSNIDIHMIQSSGMWESERTIWCWLWFTLNDILWHIVPMAMFYYEKYLHVSTTSSPSLFFIYLKVFVEQKSISRKIITL